MIHRVTYLTELPNIDAPAIAYVRETGKWYFRHADTRIGQLGWTDYHNVHFCADRPEVEVSGPPSTRIRQYYDVLFGLPTHTDMAGNINVNSQDVLLMTPQPVRALYGGTPGLNVQRAQTKTAQWDLHDEPFGYCALSAANQGARTVGMAMGPKRVPRFNYHPNFQLPNGQYCSTFNGCYLEIEVPTFKGAISVTVSAFDGRTCVASFGQAVSEPFYGIGLQPASDPRLIRYNPPSLAAALPTIKGLVNVTSVPIEPILIGRGVADAFTPAGKNTITIRGGEQPGQMSGLQSVEVGDYVGIWGKGRTRYYRVTAGQFSTTPPVNEGLQYSIYEDPRTLTVTPGLVESVGPGTEIEGFAAKRRYYTAYYGGTIRVPIKYVSAGTLGLGAPLPCNTPQGLYKIVADKDTTMAAFKYSDPSLTVYGEEYDRTIFAGPRYYLTVDQQSLLSHWRNAKAEALQVYWDSDNKINSNLNNWFPAQFAKYGPTFEAASRTIVRRLSELGLAEAAVIPNHGYYSILQY
jgi:hypothetical protein